MQQQPLLLARQQPHDERRGYYGSYEYNLQATEDQEDGIQRKSSEEGEEGEKKPAPRHIHMGDLPDYKPTPLRWPFILTLVALLCVAIGLIVYAQKAMPDSDTDAVILGLNPSVVQPNPTPRRRFIRALNETTTGTTESVVIASTTTVEGGSTSALGTSGGVVDQSTLGGSSQVTPASTSTSTSISGSSTTVVLTDTSSVDTSVSSSPSAGRPGPQTSEIVSDTSSLTHNKIDSSSTATGSRSTTTLTNGVTVVPTSTGISIITSNVTIPGSTVAITTNITTIRTVPITLSATPLVSTSVSYQTYSFWVPTATLLTTATVNGSAVSSAYSTIGTSTFTTVPVQEEFTLSAPATTASGPGGGGGGGGSPSFTTITEVVQSTSFTVLPGTVIPEFGQVTVTYYETIARDQDPSTVKNEKQPDPIETTLVVVVGGDTTTYVQPVGPPVILAVPTDEVKIEVVNPVETGVTFVGGVVVTNTLVITPTPVVAVPRVTTVNGVPTTVQDIYVPAAPGQPVTYTVVTEVGGVPTTQVVVATATGPPYEPITYTTTRVVGGTPTVVTLQPPPTTFVTTIDGTPITTITTPPATSFTTTLGGTLTTELVVTTPSGSEPITLTFVSTSGGSLSTYTRTLGPTTLVTTISGKLTTITSSPSLTTITSTMAKSTRTYVSTLTPTGTRSPESTSSVVASTKVYSWGPDDLFVGTFLPPLIGIALVMLIRVIDLNVKLYQPFQSLARGEGASGAEALTMQYSGVMAFVTPAVTMLQGHPIPFISTLMVGCASFIVPLATESIGLKLHGTCYLNTADERCGPALGISPTPANVLIGLIAAVIIMLLLVLFFSMRFPTGLHANPWNIAGIASLAGNTQVRIRQNSEHAMRQAVSDKQYGLGYFQNSLGNLEYGIVLLDESGRGLQDESQMDNEPFDGTTTARVGPKKLLPFMPLRLPWRIALILFQLTILIFIIYYHVYYNGKINDGGKLWTFMNSNTFGVRFMSAAVGVVIAFCWQSFFLSISAMTPYQLMARRTQLAERSILFSPSTNPFSGIYAAVKNRHLFLFATSFAAILSEFLPVLLSNIPFSLAQPYLAASLCAIMSSVFLSILIAVLVASFFVRYPPMPVDPRSIAGSMWYVSQSHILADFNGISQLNAKEREYRVKIMGKRYFYGVLVGGSWRRMGVDADWGPGDNAVTAYVGAGRRSEEPAVHGPDLRML